LKEAKKILNEGGEILMKLGKKKKVKFTEEDY
jgi:hypothetical protein